MFPVILRSTWSWTRTVVLGLAALTFFMPALAWRLTEGSARGNAMGLINSFAVLGPLLGFTALFGAFLLAVYPWTIDAETKHVYALSLPVEWPRYVGMRYVAGALTLLLPALALYLGSRFTVAFITLPELLQAYPGALAIRFLLAMMVSYSLSFALQYLAGHNATKVLLVFLLGIVLVVSVFEMAGMSEFGRRVGSFLFEWPGPLAIFTQTWVLIDV